ncbi:hypothetical protein [Agrobacterium tumefaciens]|uniref:hypothetical protein n=1 Tax=Agrobacterium tumefaciens TaxID=358 RepID=UPI0012DABFB8|nr:hypothetical protein [Agrobacterium tumefaciens]
MFVDARLGEPRKRGSIGRPAMRLPNSSVKGTGSARLTASMAESMKAFRLGLSSCGLTPTTTTLFRTCPSLCKINRKVTTNPSASSGGCQQAKMASNISLMLEAGVGSLQPRDCATACIGMPASNPAENSSKIKQENLMKRENILSKSKPRKHK